jgi:hypothetical protein
MDVMSQCGKLKLPSNPHTLKIDRQPPARTLAKSIDKNAAERPQAVLGAPMVDDLRRSE